MDEVNSLQLKNLKTESRIFKSEDASPGGDSYLNQLDTNCSAAGQLELKKGAQVILIR